MTKDEFLDLMKKTYTTYTHKEYRRIIEFHQSWVCGGVTGGNCWGDSADTGVYAEDTPDSFMFEIIKNFCPNVSFVEGTELMKRDDIYNVGEFDIREYYGNYTTYKYRFYHFDRIYDLIKDYM